MSGKTLEECPVCGALYADNAAHVCNVPTAQPLFMNPSHETLQGMFTRRRINDLEAAYKVMREALDVAITTIKLLQPGAHVPTEADTVGGVCMLCESNSASRNHNTGTILVDLERALNDPAVVKVEELLK